MPSRIVKLQGGWLITARIGRRELLFAAAVPDQQAAMNAIRRMVTGPSAHVHAQCRLSPRAVMRLGLRPCSVVKLDDLPRRRTRAMNVEAAVSNPVVRR